MQTIQCLSFQEGIFEQMKAYVELQEKEFAAENVGYTATKHQREVEQGILIVFFKQFKELMLQLLR